MKSILTLVSLCLACGVATAQDRDEREKKRDALRERHERSMHELERQFDAERERIREEFEKRIREMDRDRAEREPSKDNHETILERLRARKRGKSEPQRGDRQPSPPSREIESMIHRLADQVERLNNEVQRLRKDVERLKYPDARSESRRPKPGKKSAQTPERGLRPDKVVVGKAMPEGTPEKVRDLVGRGDLLFKKAMGHLLNSDPRKNPEGWRQENKAALEMFTKAVHESYIPAQDSYGDRVPPQALLNRIRATMMRASLCRKRVSSK